MRLDEDWDPNVDIKFMKGEVAVIFLRKLFEGTSVDNSLTLRSQGNYYLMLDEQPKGCCPLTLW